MSFSPLIKQLIDSLRCLPGVGVKSAQRMALHLLERDRSGGMNIVNAMREALLRIEHCTVCRMFSETNICHLCRDEKRDDSLLCVVESMVDVFALDGTASYNGHYFVLHGRLSPLDGIGPEVLGMQLLAERLAQGTITEVIIATNPTVEGEATAHYIAELAKPYSLVVSRIASGVPLGGELEYLDGGTLTQAMQRRIRLTEDKLAGQIVE